MAQFIVPTVYNIYLLQQRPSYERNFSYAHRDNSLIYQKINNNRKILLTPGKSVCGWPVSRRPGCSVAGNATGNEGRASNGSRYDSSTVHGSGEASWSNRGSGEGGGARNGSAEGGRA